MRSLQFDTPSYRSHVRFSRKKHILVEGPTDKRVFTLFIDALSRKYETINGLSDIKIDTAALIKGNGIGQREKIEIICQSMSNEIFDGKFVGFVDREFREFEQVPRIADLIRSHKIEGSLVWSRGHSIENYIFDFDLLRNPLKHFSVTDKFREALDLFEDIFEDVIRLACALSLTGYELEKLILVKGSVSPEILEIREDMKTELAINEDKWKDNLVNLSRVQTDQANEIVAKYHFWEQVVKDSDFDSVRWLCHGHIGIAFIWSAYSKCVFDVCLNECHDIQIARAEARKVLKADESVRFNACASEWVERAIGDHYDYPFAVFDLLNVDLSVSK